MKKTALFDKHLALGARIIAFAGWQMPVYYTGIIEEHLTVRRAVGLFDIGHMGQLEISGPDAFAFLQYVTTFDISRLALGEAHYSLLCYADGTVVDDIFVYRLPERYFLVVNAANTGKDMRWLLYHGRYLDVKIRDMSDGLCMLALQGSHAEAVLQPLTDANLGKLKYPWCVEGAVADVATFISRTGYTGEDGFELIFAAEEAANIWDTLMAGGAAYGIQPVGLGARDTLRFEAVMPLYGHELSASVNPYEARLGWAISLEQPDFVGKEALLKVRMEGIQRRMVGFEIVEGGVAREGFEIYHENRLVGFVTSGAYAPTFGKKLGLGLVPRELAVRGTELEIAIRKKMAKAVVVEIPFYASRMKR